MKKLALILALLMAAGIFLTACPGEGANPNKPGSTDPVITDPTDPDAPYKNPDGTWKITAPVYDMGGATFSILVRSNAGSASKDIDFTYLEANDGEPINDAANRRIIEIEEMYKINVKVIQSPHDSHLQQIRASVTAGDDAYTITFNTSRTNNTLAQEGILYNLLDFPNINPDEPWWNKNVTNAASIGGKIYLLAGDISIHYVTSVFTLMFNKQMIEDLGLPSPYTLVRNNEWTFDKVAEMCKVVYENLNAEGDLTSLTRVVGWTGFDGSLSQSLTACGVPICRKDADDIPYLDFYNERTFNIFEKVTSILYDDTLFYNWQRGANNSREGKVKFLNNEALFFWREMFVVQELRAMETDFGFIPQPKYESSQPRYYHHINSAEACILAIPVGPWNEANKEQIGAIVSALAVMGKNYITPAYYDATLEGKYTRDEDSSEMLDIIFNAVQYDIGRVFDIGGLSSRFNSIHNGKQTNIASIYESISSSMDVALEKVLDAYANLD